MFNEFFDFPMEKKKEKKQQTTSMVAANHPILVEWIHTQWTMKWKRGKDVVKKIPEIQPKIKE